MYGHEIEIGAQPNSHASCKCRTINNIYHWQLLPILHFIKTVRTKHFSYCPRYVQSKRKVDFVIQLAPPSWLLSRTIDLGLQMKYLWSTRYFRMSPIIVGTSRLVDSNLSPAFLAVRNAREKLKEAGFHRSNIYILNLENALKDLFNNGKASPLDTDRSGHTLLYVSK